MKSAFIGLRSVSTSWLSTTLRTAQYNDAVQSSNAGDVLDADTSKWTNKYTKKLNKAKCAQNYGKN